MKELAMAALDSIESVSKSRRLNGIADGSGDLMP
jgi:hypothetical protein